MLTRLRHIGLAIDLSASYARDLFRGVSAYAFEHGPWRFEGVRLPALGVEEMLRDAPFDGMIVRAPTRLIARWITASGKPTVSITGAALGLPTVALDDVEVGRLAARHLLEASPAELAYVGRRHLWYSDLREQGFREAAAAAGCACSSLPIRSGKLETVHGQVTDTVRQLPPRVGILASDDLIARHVLEACAELGRPVPDDVSVVGAGNNELFCELASPPLTSVALAPERVGYEAARALHGLMQGKPGPAEPVLIPPVGVVARGSTSTRPLPDPDLSAAMSFIREHATEGIGVEDVLRVVPLSRRRLEIGFKELLGISPGEEIRRVRIERAKRMLTESDVSMAGVARGCGFSSPNQLSDTFRRETGVSPSEYRRKFRAG